MLNGFKSYLKNKFRPHPLKRKFREEIKGLKKEIKLVIGAGSNNFENWVSTDIDQLNVLLIKDWKYLFKGKKITNILSEHVWEHLTLQQARIANKLCFYFLAKNGKLRIAVPDGYFPDPSYIEYVRPGGVGAGADDHKILYNYILMKEELQKVGFVVDILEYWDENGAFHYKDWDPIEGGMINRSKRFDKRNFKNELKYTSLIIDAIKP